MHFSKYMEVFLMKGLKAQILHFRLIALKLCIYKTVWDKIN